MIQDRLYGITIYLLNHERVSASTLAKEFEVSLRTIQRDVDRLCIAGIPIVAYSGVDGGYEIDACYKLKNQRINDQEYGWIYVALQALCSAFKEKEVDALLRKYETLPGVIQPIEMDLQVMKEHTCVMSCMKQILMAVENRKRLRLDYVNQKQEQHSILIDPIGCQYRWYHWYLIGYDHERNTYRMYKLIRIQKMQEEGWFMKQHPSLSAVTADMKQEKQSMMHIVLQCDAVIKAGVREYLQGTISQETADSFLLTMEVPASEHFWFANVLAFADHIKVIEPLALQQRVQHHCERILKQMKS